MINVTAKPAWQWSGQNASARLPSTRTNSAIISPLKQALMPRSVDLNFSLKYRR